MADEKVNIKVTADTRQAKASLNELSEKMQNLGGRMTAAFTLPIVGAFAAAISQSKMLQESLVPIQQAFSGVAAELGNALVPVIREFTPMLLKVAGALSDMVRWFADLDQPTKNFVVGLAGVIAVAGPVLMFLGNVGGTIAGIQGLVTGLGFAMPGLSAAFTTFGATAAAALVPLLPLLAAVAALMALVNSEFGKKGILAGKQSLAFVAAGFGGITGGQQGAQDAFYNSSKSMGLFDQPAPARAGGTVINYNYANYGIDANNPNLKAALAPYINNQLRGNGQR